MKEILDKISSYNLFNYFLPGVIFSFMTAKICDINLLQQDIITGAFVYYFIGLVISRFGSIIIEPFLKKISFVKFADYKDFVVATQKDNKIETLSESNNMYRTFISMLTLIGLLKIYKYLESQLPILTDYNLIILVLILLIMFLFSYRKQTNYITKRIKVNNK